MDDNAIAFQVLIEQLKAAEFDTQTELFKQLQKELRSAIAAADDLSTKAQLKALQTELTEIMQRILGDYVSGFNDTLKQLNVDAHNMELSALNSVAPQGVSFATVDAAKLWANTRSRALMVKGYTGDLLLEKFISGWIKPEIQRVNNLVTQSYLEGRTNKELIDAILGTRSLQYRDALLETSRRNADAIARTAIQHVASVTRQQTWQANRDLITGYKFNATLDSRTSDTCRALDGRMFEFEQGPTPPMHVRCRSTTVPVLNDAFDWLKQGRSRASNSGYVSSNETYYSWLKKQPEYFQVNVLGAERAQLFRNGGLTAEKFAALQLDKNFRPLTLDQMRAIAPKVFKKAGL